jgi:hypothetical protein
MASYLTGAIALVTLVAVHRLVAAGLQDAVGFP